MDLRRLLSIAWKRRATLVAVVLVAVITSAVIAYTRPPRYESTAVLALTPSTEAGQGVLSADNFDALMRTYAETAKAAVTRQRAEATLGRRLPGAVHTDVETGTGILRISVRADDPTEAAAAASAVATAFGTSLSDSRLLEATVVTPAEPSSSPVEPRPALIVGAATVLAILGGLLLVVALENLRRRITTATDVAELTPVPVLGWIPFEPALSGGRGRSAWDLTDAPALQESFRALRTNLALMLGREACCIQVTSAEEGQGKSFVVANLAIAFAQVGRSTVVVDADLRRPSQSAFFGCADHQGLAAALAGEDEVEPLPTAHPGLRLLASGSPSSDPTELLHIRGRSVLAGLRAEQTLVLVDTPPLLPVSDARIIAPAVDGVLLVVEAGRQRPAALQTALAKLDLVGADLIGIILNRTAEDPAAGRYPYTDDDGGGRRSRRDEREPGSRGAPDVDRRHLTEDRPAVDRAPDPLPPPPGA